MSEWTVQGPSRPAKHVAVRKADRAECGRGTSHHNRAADRSGNAGDRGFHGALSTHNGKRVRRAGPSRPHRVSVRAIQSAFVFSVLDPKQRAPIGPISAAGALYDDRLLSDRHRPLSLWHRATPREIALIDRDPLARRRSGGPAALLAFPNGGQTGRSAARPATGTLPARGNPWVGRVESRVSVSLHAAEGAGLPPRHRFRVKAWMVWFGGVRGFSRRSDQYAVQCDLAGGRVFATRLRRNFRSRRRHRQHAGVIDALYRSARFGPLGDAHELF